MKRRYIYTLIISRSLLFFSILFGLSRSYDLGASFPLLLSGGLAGIWTGTFFAQSKLLFRGFLLLQASIYLLMTGSFWTIQTFFPTITSEVFTVASLQNDIELTYFLFLTLSLISWLIIRVPGAITVELVGILLGYTLIFSGHRNFHFESPQILNSLAWELSTNPLMIITYTGLVGFILFVVYARLASLFSSHHKNEVISVHGSTPKVSAIGVLAVLLSFVALATYGIYNHFYTEQQTRTANGVGQTQSPGLSPLGFHSALGSTSQPAALVRLEGDYEKNPFIPMMYLRESALSTYNGRELVMAERLYDQDIPGVSPEQNFSADPDATMENRKEITLSAYLLAEHNYSFALDYPVSINPIKNPNPGKFKKAFRSVSLAPQFTLDELADNDVGDPRWSKETWDHYLKPSSDSRYTETALRIVQEAMAVTPIQRAFALTTFLSKNATYTLTPGHEVGQTEDPVAPFLFGDMKGYCVHFAHATVYMLRALGIPARIGTGYLTDLSQARDGHILLRMSDRHAWAEVYIKGKGWVPFDTKPEKVESHAETQVDMKLLEELMGMIGPDETILPKDIAKDESHLEEEFILPEFNILMVLPYLLFILSIIYLTKLYLHISWIFPAKAATKIRRTYRAFASWYCDLGYQRYPAETRQEFRERLSSSTGSELMLITPLALKVRYFHLSGDDSTQLRSIRLAEVKNGRSIHWLRRLLGVLNPTSVFVTLLGDAW